MSRKLAKTIGLEELFEQLKTLTAANDKEKKQEVWSQVKEKSTS